MTDFQSGLAEAARQVRLRADEYDRKRIRAVEEGHPRSEARYERIRDLFLDQAACLEAQAQHSHAAAE